jgi:hypothetical protein
MVDTLCFPTLDRDVVERQQRAVTGLFQLPTQTPTSRPSRCRMNTAQVTAKQIA